MKRIQYVDACLKLFDHNRLSALMIPVQSGVIKLNCGCGKLSCMLFSLHLIILLGEGSELTYIIIAMCIQD